MEIVSASPQENDETIYEDDSRKDLKGRRLVQLSLVAMGVVFGDIGTSPLYAIRECFHGEYGIAVTPANVLGVLSLMFWALVMIVTVKYVTFILKVDNHGEGGVLALTALVKPKESKTRGLRWPLVPIGLFAACLLYGDGMITPAISVLSAVEGVRIVTPLFKPYVVPLTISILAGLFLFQHRGTSVVGSFFGPIVLIWFCVLAVLGLLQIIHDPQVLFAVFPAHAFRFLLVNKMHGFVVLMDSWKSPKLITYSCWPMKKGWTSRQKTPASIWVVSRFRSATILK